MHTALGYDPIWSHTWTWPHTYAEQGMPFLAGVTLMVWFAAVHAAALFAQELGQVPTW